MNAALVRDLAALLGPEGVRDGADVRPYLRDSTEMQGLEGRADAVAAPGSVEQVRSLVSWCYERGLPIVPRGGGTGAGRRRAPTAHSPATSTTRVPAATGRVTNARRTRSGRSPDVSETSSTP